MFRKAQFPVVFNTIFSIVFSAALTFFVKLTSNQLTIETFFMGLVPAFAINFVLGTYIPLLKIGNKFAAIFIKREEHPLFYFLRMLAIVFIMTAAMSLLVMFSEIGFQSVLIFAFVSSFPATFLFAYLVGVCVFPILLKITQRLCTE